ncbi:hypothetical protein ABMW84_002805 [Acinetobacter baumannii]|nr:hypothetical protein [Acinetobacter baumannii]ELB0733666.1 hypothetical protein [Acinetobacter baumannii]ELB0789850.1 hypothetical protein [Acinetobacter baumannii]ELS8957227.1 hypothetical protein [Acinetobacter baumannii]ELT0410192.1 hypothetical protein [Acinetobacter baumannii]
MLQYLIIAVLVIWSAIVVFKKVFPKTANSAFSALSVFCEKQGWATLAKWLKPKMTFGCAGGCGCSGEDKPTNTIQEIKPVKWQ